MSNRNVVHRLTRESVERMCARSVLKPEKRTAYKGRDIFICDGISLAPERDFKRFGAEPGDFVLGAYCTIWFVAKGEDHFEVGSPALYDISHNPELDPASKKQGRINRAERDARKFIDALKRVERPANAIAI